MKKRTLFTSFLLITLSACNSSPNNPDGPGPGPGPDPEPGVTLQECIDEILKHNYTLTVETELLNEKSTAVFYNIDDNAFFEIFNGVTEGKIKQADQGYVSFGVFDNTISVSNFYSVNNSVGVSKVFPYTGEYLLDVEYVETEQEGVYKTIDSTAIGVGGILTGYQTAYMVSPEAIYASLIDENVTVTGEYTLYYEEEGEHFTETLSVKFTFTDVGTTRNEIVESYINNPTTTFTIPTSWSNSELEAFNDVFHGLVPSFLPGASYALKMQVDGEYDGASILLTDYACGNRVEEYANLLINVDGFTKISNKTYRKVEKDNESQKTKTHTVELVYKGPESDTVDAVRYPNGIFQAKYYYREKNNVVDSAEAFNDYIIGNGLNDVIPLFPFVDTCVKITGFDDRTVSYNAANGTDYLFTTGNTTTRVFIDTYQNTLKALRTYIALLEDYGYEDAGTMFGMKTMKLEPDSGVASPSTIKITDPDKFLESTFNSLGCFDIQFRIDPSARELVKK